MAATAKLARLLSLAAALVVPMTAFAYDGTWYRTDFWAGEYPNGFTLAQDVTVRIRKEPLPAALQDTDCGLNKGETFHPWNGERVDASKLEFLTYVKKVTYRIKSPATILLQDENSESDREVDFKPGDRWTYLTYYGEGMFRLELEGKEYAAEQDLFEVSDDKGDREHDEDEWMKLTCANGTTGWLLFADVADEPAFKKPDFPEYGRAVDER
jgi:hypothetical protein